MSTTPQVIPPGFAIWQSQGLGSRGPHPCSPRAMARSPGPTERHTQSAAVLASTRLTTSSSVECRKPLALDYLSSSTSASRKDSGSLSQGTPTSQSSLGTSNSVEHNKFGLGQQNSLTKANVSCVGSLLQGASNPPSCPSSQRPAASVPLSVVSSPSLVLRNGINCCQGSRQTLGGLPSYSLPTDLSHGTWLRQSSLNAYPQLLECEASIARSTSRLPSGHPPICSESVSDTLEYPYSSKSMTPSHPTLLGSPPTLLSIQFGEGSVNQSLLQCTGSKSPKRIRGGRPQSRDAGKQLGERDTCASSPSAFMRKSSSTRQSSSPVPLPALPMQFPLIPSMMTFRELDVVNMAPPTFANRGSAPKLTFSPDTPSPRGVSRRGEAATPVRDFRWGNLRFGYPPSPPGSLARDPRDTPGSVNRSRLGSPVTPARGSTPPCSPARSPPRSPPPPRLRDLAATRRKLVQALLMSSQQSNPAGDTSGGESLGSRWLLANSEERTNVVKMVEELLFETMPRENVIGLKVALLHNERSRQRFLRTLRADEEKAEEKPPPPPPKTFAQLRDRSKEPEKSPEKPTVRATWHLAGDPLAADAIEKEGIRCSEGFCSSGRYGQGGYVAATAFKANAYADPDAAAGGAPRDLFLVFALPEEDCITHTSGSGFHGRRPPKTVADAPNHPTEYCFVDDNRLHCVCRLTYFWAPTGRREKVKTDGLAAGGRLVRAPSMDAASPRKQVSPDATTTEGLSKSNVLTFKDVSSRQAGA